jgi:hypothetical protein
MVHYHVVIFGLQNYLNLTSQKGQPFIALQFFIDLKTSF